MPSSGWSVRRLVTKPWYVFRPGQIVRRLTWQVWGSRAAEAEVRLRWGLPVRVRPRELIGSALMRTGVHDLPVTEAVFRLLDPGDVAVDAGANIGYMTSVMAARVGPGGAVHAFEPHPELVGLLERNARSWAARPWSGRVEAHPVALSDTEGRGALRVPERFEQNMGVATLEAPADGMPLRDTIDVPLRTLDDCLGNEEAPVGVLKLDVEGHEHAVLRGAARLLRRGRVRDVVFEEHGAYPTPVSRYLEAAGYDVVLLRVGLRGLSVVDPRSDDGRGDYDGRNFLATRDLERARARLTGGWRALRPRSPTAARPRSAFRSRARRPPAGSARRR
jgi:FkbM family methyltransferase